jgi:hypothetical protein
MEQRMANTTPFGDNSGLSANLLPGFYQTTPNKKFLQATIDQLYQPGNITKVNGYIGRENSKATVVSDTFVSSVDATRKNYQLEPGIVIKDNLGNVEFFKDYIDYINQINVFCAFIHSVRAHHSKVSQHNKRSCSSQIRLESRKLT